jgi:sortase A
VQRRAQILGWTLIWSGVLVFGYVGWQVWGTNFHTTGVQARGQVELAGAIRVGGLDPVAYDPSEILGEVPPPPDTPTRVEFTPETAPERGEAFAFIRIPKIDVDQVVFAGVDTQTLRSGPGHMEGTPVPGQPGNAVLSGHRTTYGAPFHDLDLLVPGDRIEVETFAGTHVYEVRELQVVAPNAWWVTDPRPGGWLTLTTCHPKFSARERLIVWAEMVDGPNHAYIRLQAGSDSLPEGAT